LGKKATDSKTWAREHSGWKLSFGLHPEHASDLRS
jgi:hypothetical protein